MSRKKIEFAPGKKYIPVSGKVFDEKEINNAIKVAKDGWWTEGEFSKKFESSFKNFLGVQYASLVNSGSSANLVAVAALTSKVFGERRLQSGDEFITTAVAFPTTVNPGVLYGLRPVFIDSSLKDLNGITSQIKKAITKKTKLIMMAHTLGIPFDIDEIMRLARKNNIWVIEDCCDALGSRYNNRLLGTFGDIATFSFYPAHQITMGEGGAVATNNPFIYRSILQFRDWGRDCWCDTGTDNVCGKRFGWKLGDLPQGYDHKYTYSQIGYNLKLTDFQAAIGLAQLEKLPDFIKKRKLNYKILASFFSKYSNYFSIPQISSKKDPCWFGFPVIVNSKAPFTRNEITEFLEKNKIGTRTIFSGNLLRHPAYRDLDYKVYGTMKNADIVMKQAFWIGVYPGITKPMMTYVKKKIYEFMQSIEKK